MSVHPREGVIGVTKGGFSCETQQESRAFEVPGRARLRRDHEIGVM